MLRGVNAEIRENYSSSNCVHLSAEVGPTFGCRTCGRRNQRKKLTAFKKYTVRVFRPDRSPQNAQWIKSSPLSNIRIIGRVWVSTRGVQVLMSSIFFSTGSR
jgi:hypothetical protein